MEDVYVPTLTPEEIEAILLYREIVAETSV